MNQRLQAEPYFGSISSQQTEETIGPVGWYMRVKDTNNYILYGGALQPKFARKCDCEQACASFNARNLTGVEWTEMNNDGLSKIILENLQW